LRFLRDGLREMLHGSAAYWRWLGLLGVLIAVAAVICAMLSVTVDLGHPERVWHMFPVVGRFSGPMSLLAWNVVVLSGCLVSNLSLPLYVHFSLLFVAVELFTDLHNETRHAGSIRYLFFRLGGLGSLRAWIWTSLAVNVVAVTILTIHPLRRSKVALNAACVLAFVGIWIEKGKGVVVPGFIPTPLGEVFAGVDAAAGQHAAQGSGQEHEMGTHVGELRKSLLRSLQGPRGGPRCTPQMRILYACPVCSQAPMPSSAQAGPPARQRAAPVPAWPSASARPPATAASRGLI